MENHPKISNILRFQVFVVSLQKISCISAKYSSKLDILHSICIIFAEDKLHLSFLNLNIEDRQ